MNAGSSRPEPDVGKFRYMQTLNHSSMVGHVLEAVWMNPPRQTHPAWANETTAFISTDLVNLAFAGTTPVQVFPCEVPIPEAYPALGIGLRDLSNPLQAPKGWQPLEQLYEIQQCLPAEITEVHVWDALGEGPISAIRLVLATGLALTVRHQYPPMMLGKLFTNRFWLCHSDA